MDGKGCQLDGKRIGVAPPVLDLIAVVKREYRSWMAPNYHRPNSFATLFMDVTDAWFEGRGPEMAERNRTKEGFKNRRKIGIDLYKTASCPSFLQTKVLTVESWSQAVHER